MDTPSFERVGANGAECLQTAKKSINIDHHISNPLTGLGDRGLTAFGEKQLFWSGWTSSCYFFLADRYGS